MKLKLSTRPLASDGAPAEASANGAAQASPAPSATPKLALKFKPSAAPAGEPSEGAAGDAPKKRKYTKKPKVDENGLPLPPPTKPGPKPKKRATDDGEQRDPTKRQVKPTMKSLSYVQESDEDDDEPAVPSVSPAIRQRHPARSNSIKISIKKSSDSKSRGSAPAILKVIGKGRPPTRPPGVGYDSEAEEAERDPAIESQFILRMAPGPDSDLLRKSIEEKTIGKSASNGGPGVQFRFFDREGRKAMITIQNRMYAATMVELPCVIESLKSWNKKDWVKSADVCQMLLVLGRVNNEEEVKKLTRPREVEPESYRYPHGLTPPMRWARKRRFRPRKSYLDVERIETATEELLTLDENAESADYQLIESGDEVESSDGSVDDDEDEEMPDAEDQQTGADEDALMAMLNEEFEDGDQMEVEADGDVDVDALFGNGTEVEVETPAAGGAHEVAMHALAQNGNIVIQPESAASTPAAATSPDDDDDDDDDDDGDEEDEDIDPEELEKQRLEEQIRDEIAELTGTIEENKAKKATTNNPIFAKRLQTMIDQLVATRSVKLSRLGMSEDD